MKTCKICNYNEATTSVNVEPNTTSARVEGVTACCEQCKEWQEDIAWHFDQFDKLDELLAAERGPSN